MLAPAGRDHLGGDRPEHRDSDGAARLASEVQKLCTTEGYKSDELEALQPLAGVSRFPVRVKCATLPWHTLKAALAGEREATTE